MSGPRTVRAPRGPSRTCKGWIQEAALRMLMNNLDPEVAERRTTRRCSCSPGSRSACSPRTPTRRAS